MVELRKNYIGDDEQVARINAKVGKHDTIIFLGDIGNVEMIRKIRGHKVLIMGNHDKGASKYKRKIALCGWAKSKYTKEYVLEHMKTHYPGWVITIRDNDVFWHAKADNGLFDEVYEGPLFIADKLLLSHEPIDLPFAFNIHGHDHSGWHGQDGRHLNVCAEHIDYTPVNLNRLLKGGLLSKVDSIHRMTIDKAVEKKKRTTDRLYDHIWDMYVDEFEDIYALEDYHA
jgi:calcineurin-like phosphoesterase family protein